MTNAPSGKRRYLALWFPFLPAQRLRKKEIRGQSRTQPDAPLVLIRRSGNALRLAAVDEQSQALGLVPGQSLADARACQPDLAVAEMDEPADARFLTMLARQCMDFSPAVEVVPPDAIVLDITGVTHLFGGEMPLADRLADYLRAEEVTVRHALADTADAAQALARHVGFPLEDEAAAIHALPVAALGLKDEAVVALRRAGLKQVGDIASRPLASIAARFGGTAVTALRRLLGDEPAPLSPITPATPLRVERRFAEPVALQSSIAASFQDMLNEAAEMLEKRDLGGKRFVLALFRSDGARHLLEIETGLPTRDPALVLRLFDERIGALADPLDPGFGYDNMALMIPVTDRLLAVQNDLSGQSSTDGRAGLLIDQLSTRLGPGAVRRIVPQDSHVPEQGQLALPAIECPAPRRWPAAQVGEPPLRPLYLFDPPQQVTVIAQVPDGPPHRFRWRRTLHEIRLFEGPERIAGEWWRRKGGEQPGRGGLTRDYYRVEDARGRRYWIFRHGLYDEKPDPRWYLHGLFA